MRGKWTKRNSTLAVRTDEKKRHKDLISDQKPVQITKKFNKNNFVITRIYFTVKVQLR